MITLEVDTVNPTITLKGQSNVTITVGGSYSDLGATASDNKDGDITSTIVVNNPVDTTTIGVYTVRYNVKDSSGNPAVEVIRTVNVVGKSNDATLSSIKVDGVSIIGFSPNTLNYEVPYDLLIPPEITTSLTDLNAQVNVIQASSFEQTAIVTVTA